MRRRDALSLALLALGVSLFHSRGLAPGQTFLAVDLANNNLPWLSGSPGPLQNWLISDPVYQFYPFLANAVETVRKGGWPLWNPHLLLGHPVVADPLAQSFYPAFLGLGLLFGAARGLALGLWLHALLAAGLTYGLLRAIGCRRPGAILGGFSYALGGYMVTWFETTFWIATLSWLPGVLWGFEAAVRHRSRRAAALGGGAMGLAFLGGQLAFAAGFALFLGLYAAGRAMELALRRERDRSRPLVASAVILAEGGLLGGVQLVPSLEWCGLSHRADLPASLDAIPAQQLITLIVPNFFGNPSTTKDYWGAMNFSEAALYAGLPALVLALLAPLHTRRFFPCYLLLLAGVILLFVVGGPGAAALASIPPFKYGSAHRFLFLLPLLVALLAGTALSSPKGSVAVSAFLTSLPAALVGLALQLDWGQARAHWVQLEGPVFQAVALLGATFGLLALRARRPELRLSADGALVALAFVDLFLAGSGYNPVGPVQQLMPPTPALRRLQDQVGLARVAAYQRGDRLLLGPNVSSLFGLSEAGGYSSLLPASLPRLVAAGDPKGGIPGIGYWLSQNGNILFFYDPSPRLLDLLQVSHVVSPTPVEGLTEVYRGEVLVYRRPEYPPRARVVYGAERIAPEDRAVTRLLDRAFDLANGAVVADSLGLPERAEIPAGPAEIVEYGDTRVMIRASAAQRGLLILADQFHPGWRVEVDGRPAAVHRVNLVLRGVVLPPGDHEVLFRFAPESLRLGAGLSCAGLAMLLGLVVADRRRRSVPRAES